MCLFEIELLNENFKSFYIFIKESLLMAIEFFMLVEFSIVKKGNVENYNIEK